ncbi:MAG: hypothetical protein VW683_10355 [Betaproteobacteria bacterium]|jgi:hypothetical protein
MRESDRTFFQGRISGRTERGFMVEIGLGEAVEVINSRIRFQADLRTGDIVEVEQNLGKFYINELLG